jgi:hypothetical protein
MLATTDYIQNRASTAGQDKKLVTFDAPYCKQRQNVTCGQKCTHSPTAGHTPLRLAEETAVPVGRNLRATEASTAEEIKKTQQPKLTLRHNTSKSDQPTEELKNETSVKHQSKI